MVPGEDRKPLLGEESAEQGEGTLAELADGSAPHVTLSVPEDEEILRVRHCYNHHGQAYCGQFLWI